MRATDDHDLPHPRRDACLRPLPAVHSGHRPRCPGCPVLAPDLGTGSYGQPLTAYGTPSPRGCRRLIPAAETPPGPRLSGCGPDSFWLQNRRAVPVAGKQRQFHLEPVPANFPAAPRDGATHPILHRVEVQVEFLGSHLVAGSPPRNTRSVSRRRPSLSLSIASSRAQPPPSRGWRPRRHQDALPRTTRGRPPKSPSAPAVSDHRHAAGGRGLRWDRRKPSTPSATSRSPRSADPVGRGRTGEPFRSLLRRGTIGQPAPSALRSAATNNGAASAPAGSASSRRNRCSRGTSSPAVAWSGYHMINAR